MYRSPLQVKNIRMIHFEPVNLRQSCGPKAEANQYLGLSSAFNLRYQNGESHAADFGLDARLPVRNSRYNLT